MGNIYRHLGYFNNSSDIEYLSNKSVNEIIDYFMNGLGHFYFDEYHDESKNLYEDNESDIISAGHIKFTKDKLFAIMVSSLDAIGNVTYIFGEDDSTDCYIDVYVLCGDDEKDNDDNEKQVNTTDIIINGKVMHIVVGKTKEDIFSIERNEELWDFDFEEFLNGAVEVNESIEYWYINGRVYEVD